MEIIFNLVIFLYSLFLENQFFIVYERADFDQINFIKIAKKIIIK